MIAHAPTAIRTEKDRLIAMVAIQRTRRQAEQLRAEIARLERQAESLECAIARFGWGPEYAR